VVNAVLQMLDSYQGRSLVVAATNHERMLDSAIWRRFEEVLIFGPPDREQLIQLLTIKLRGVRRDFEPDDRKVLSLFDEMSHADVERVLRRAIKEIVLKGEEFLQFRHLGKAQQRELSKKQQISEK
jgi:AAA+ superfamily predicted ATPase